MSIFAAFLKDENATTAIEYALIAAGISIAIVVGVYSLGSQVNAKFTAVSTAF